MNRILPDTNTDIAWEEWGRRDPYFGVITHPKFRRSVMNHEAMREFFESGDRHVEYVLQTVRRTIDPEFRPKKVLEFGCGVGRTLPALARIADSVVGIDVSPSMLREAAYNCVERNLSNVQLLPSDDSLTQVSGKFDFLHSFIVFQHIPCERGLAILKNLLEFLAPNGVGALHFTYSKSHFVEFSGLPTPPVPPSSCEPLPATPNADPEMQMNPYIVNQILFVLQRAGIVQLHIQFTDHGGELGVFVFFQRNTGPLAHF